MPDISRARAGRSEKRQILHTLESSEVTLEALLRAPEGPLRKADLWEVLLFTPKLGRKGARKVCEASGVFAHKRLGELTEHEVECVIAELPRRVRQAPLVGEETSGGQPTSHPGGS